MAPEAVGSNPIIRPKYKYPTFCRVFFILCIDLNTRLKFQAKIVGVWQFLLYCPYAPVAQLGSLQQVMSALLYPTDCLAIAS